MSRYQALRQLAECTPVTAGFVAVLNWACRVPAGLIVFGPVEMEYTHD